MKILMNGSKNWDTLSIPSNDYYKDTIEAKFKEYSKKESLKDNTLFNIVSTANTSLDTKDYVLITFTIGEE